MYKRFHCYLTKQNFQPNVFLKDKSLVAYKTKTLLKDSEEDLEIDFYILHKKRKYNQLHNLVDEIKDPKAKSFLEDEIEKIIVFFVPVKISDTQERTGIVVFGNPKNIFSEENLVKDFGDVVKKELIKKENITKLSTINFETNMTKNTKESFKFLNKINSFSDFVPKTLVDFDGKTNKILGKNIKLAGTSCLTLNVSIDFTTQIIELLKSLITIYMNADFNKPKLLLDNLLLSEKDEKKKERTYIEIIKKLYLTLKKENITKGSYRNIFLIPPAKIDLDNIIGFQITNLKWSFTKIHEELDFEVLLEQIQAKFFGKQNNNFKESDLRDLIEKIKIKCIYDNTEKVEWPLKKFLYYEFEKDKEKYFFHDMNLYKFPNNFYEELVNTIKEVDINQPITYPEYTGEAEGKYNLKLAENDHCICLDKTKFLPDFKLDTGKKYREISSKYGISPTSNVELADIFKWDQTQAKAYLIHVKIKKKSAGHNVHVFTQAKASALILKHDTHAFQTFVNKCLEAEGESGIALNTLNYTVVITMIIPSSRRKTIERTNLQKNFTLLELLALYDTLKLFNQIDIPVSLNLIR